MVTLSDISGYEIFIHEINEKLVNPIKNSDFNVPHRVIIYGPPGIGKTFVSKAIAGELGEDLRILSPTQTGKEIDDLTSNLSPNKVLFVDEIDRLDESEFLSRAIREVDETVLIIGATNHPWNIQNLISSGFESLFFMPEPDFDSRRGIIDYFLGETTENVDVDTFAILTEDCTASDIHDLIKALGESNFEETIQNNKPTTLSNWIIAAKNNLDRLDKTSFKPLLEWLDTK